MRLGVPRNEGLRPRAQLGEQRAHHTLLLLDQREQQVLGLQRLVIALVGQGLGGLHRLLRFHGQLIEPHHVLSWRSRLSSANSSFSLSVRPAGTVTCTRTN